ncbi:MAG: hypothetical protein EO766_12020 [Hydrotalea sp. AMD]|uniref:HNH endonuclease n=1 Tax=Hydrotalea sp. AMD TaxID=2501297 RepID=UPI0010257B68|nr:HNH endonuclease [Hydrotalea sp. AMD]RWZ87245.1 MAG: hypothetical protein EO766_12020 [Hydrotalea sp. AMD]
MDTKQYCQICGRLLGNVRISEHHLIPKEFKGTQTILIHDICHNKIHATFDNKSLVHTYHTVERIVEHEEIQKFINWVKNKHPDFYDKNDDTKQRHSKRRN